MNAYTTAYIINNFFYAYVLYRMFRIFYADKRTAKSIELTAYSLYAVIISITVFFNTPPLVYLLLSAGSYFFLTFLYTSTLVKRCACCSRSKFLSKLLKTFDKTFREIFPVFISTKRREKPSAFFDNNFVNNAYFSEAASSSSSHLASSSSKAPKIGRAHV